MIRKAKDSADRPLIGVRDDQEVLMGKKILIAPSMPSSSGDKGIVFGDLSQYVCRVNRSSVRVTRSTQAPGYIEQGIALYTCWMTLDAALNTVNSVAPVQYATLA
jgi:HK97 family phage major capsid protein